MTTVMRPRVAIIGLDDLQVESIAQLCGDLRTAETLEDYLQHYDWSETDIVVSGSLGAKRIAGGVHLLSIGPSRFDWPLDEAYGPANWFIRRDIRSDVPNTEREVKVADECPDRYKSLADRLASQLRNLTDPPHEIKDWTEQAIIVDRRMLIATTSNKAVALQLLLSHRTPDLDGRHPEFVVLVLPEAANLQAWFSAFLTHIHEVDQIRVPHSPPRFGSPSDWYTPQERVLAAEIHRTEQRVSQLSEKREQLEEQLRAEGLRADQEMRQAIWEDGETLVGVMTKILTDLGFKVRDMDAELEPNEQKYEDLRLTLTDRPGWEAIVEVKGYSNGTRTNDALQIRKHREHYITETGQLPDMTMWLVNPFRHMDPSSRPSPDSNVGEAADNAGAVHVLTKDMYRLWVLAQIGDLDAGDVVQELIDASPGLWKPTALAG